MGVINILISTVYIAQNLTTIGLYSLAYFIILSLVDDDDDDDHDS